MEMRQTAALIQLTKAKGSSTFLPDLLPGALTLALRESGQEGELAGGSGVLPQDHRSELRASPGGQVRRAWERGDGEGWEGGKPLAGNYITSHGRRTEVIISLLMYGKT